MRRATPIAVVWARRRAPAAAQTSTDAGHRPGNLERSGAPAATRATDRERVAADREGDADGLHQLRLASAEPDADWIAAIRYGGPAVGSVVADAGLRRSARRRSGDRTGRAHAAVLHANATGRPAISTSRGRSSPRRRFPRTRSCCCRWRRTTTRPSRLRFIRTVYERRRGAARADRSACCRSNRSTWPIARTASATSKSASSTR